MYDLSNLTISSTNPCLIVFLLDQSGSMNDRFGGAYHSKAVELASAINSNIYEIGLRCSSNKEIKNRFEIAVIGYGKNGDKVQSGWEGELSGKWVVSIKNIFDCSLGEQDEKPIWIQPYANGLTPMTKAFENARRLCNDWINWGNHRDCHPPIIINITDGEVNEESHSELKAVVNQIKGLRTNYGNMFILNIHISSQNGNRILYPNDVSSINDVYAKMLFEMSTQLDENMIKRARQHGYNLYNNAKGYVFNGNANDLMNFLNIGTPR